MRRCALCLALLVGCTRSADIRDDPDGASVIVTPVPLPDGGIPEVADAGLDRDAFAPCAERRAGGCAGSNDFPCDFPRWVDFAVDDCRIVANCQARGWLSVHMSEAGCVDSIGMTDPLPVFVECLVERLGASRCTCSDVTEDVYLGPGSLECPKPDAALGVAGEPLD
jgi:hypothetical protein